MGKFLIRETATGVKFDLLAHNGEVIAASEVYETRKACLAGIESLRRNAPSAALEDQTVPDFPRERHPKFEVYRDRAEQFRFRLKAANGRIIAVSDGYRSHAGCINGVLAVRKNAAGAPVTEG